jgi:membrane protein YqaA with SNARE-associated domain
MCPACVESAAVMAAGAVSTGGILAVWIGKFNKFFHMRNFVVLHKKFQKTKEK